MNRSMLKNLLCVILTLSFCIGCKTLNSQSEVAGLNKDQLKNLAVQVGIPASLVLFSSITGYQNLVSHNNKVELATKLAEEAKEQREQFNKDATEEFNLNVGRNPNEVESKLKEIVRESRKIVENEGKRQGNIGGNLVIDKKFHEALVSQLVEVPESNFSHIENGKAIYKLKSGKKVYNITTSTGKSGKFTFSYDSLSGSKEFSVTKSIVVTNKNEIVFEFEFDEGTGKFSDYIVISTREIDFRVLVQKSLFVELFYDEENNLTKVDGALINSFQVVYASNAVTPFSVLSQIAQGEKAQEYLDQLERINDSLVDRLVEESSIKNEVPYKAIVPFVLLAITASSSLASKKTREVNWALLLFIAKGLVDRKDNRALVLLKSALSNYEGSSADSIIELQDDLITKFEELEKTVPIDENQTNDDGSLEAGEPEPLELPINFKEVVKEAIEIEKRRMSR